MGTAYAQSAPSATTVTMEQLLREMVDMQRLALPPVPGIESRQQSSYDRASTSPDADGWFANGDAGQFIRQEQNEGRTEWVMAEMTGPGAILRLWSANPDGGGTIRIYIDGSTTPALEEDFLALTTEQVPGFPAPFSGRRALGANLYFPIPYRSSCKVTVSSPGLYYHVGYRTYPAGTHVEPFSMEAVRMLSGVIREVGAVLANPNQLLYPRSRRTARLYELEAAGTAGASRTMTLVGPRAVARFEAWTDLSGPDLVKALRGVLLTIRWDGESQPSVVCPLGDFFGSAPGVNPYETLATGMDSDGTGRFKHRMYCNFWMPFAASAEITITNTTDTPTPVVLTAWTHELTWPEGGLLRFRAKWRKEWLPVDPVFVDWPMLECTGPGRFVGTMLGVVNTDPGWWGEGDEKIWVDDDKFPSFFGTGSEDYFGYAWCNTTLFSHAYHSQSICTGPGNFGYTAVSRLHILDDIPFHSRYRMYIEKWAVADREYCTTCYWYSAPGATDFYKPLTPEDLVVRPLEGMRRVEGALEGEELELAASDGVLELQSFVEASGWKHIWWRGAQPGARLTVKVPVAEPGRYLLTLGMCTAVDYGIHRAYWDGKPVGGPFDAYNNGIRFTSHDFGTVEVARTGEHILEIEIVGKNPNAVPEYMFGLDYVLLTPEG